MIKIDQLKLDVSVSENQLNSAIAKKLRINEKDIKSYHILKRSIDARKSQICFCLFCCCGA